MEHIIRSWNGRTIRQREDGYLSLTDMAQACGKLFADWRRLKSVKTYLDRLSQSMGITVDQLIEINESLGSNEARGTWGHPQVAEEFGRWCLLPRKDKSKPGMLYVYQDANNNAYKIGYTTDIGKRQKQHYTSNPFLELVKVYADVTVDFEALVHIKLTKYRIPNTTEWYVRNRSVLSIVNLLYSDYINKSQEYGGILVEVFKNA
jgi:hypothetical protein